MNKVHQLGLDGGLKAQQCGRFIGNCNLEDSHLDINITSQTLQAPSSSFTFFLFLHDDHLGWMSFKSSCCRGNQTKFWGFAQKVNELSRTALKTPNTTRLLAFLGKSSTQYGSLIVSDKSTKIYLPWYISQELLSIGIPSCYNLLHLPPKSYLHFGYVTINMSSNKPKLFFREIKNCFEHKDCGTGLKCINQVIS